MLLLYFFFRDEFKNALKTDLLRTVRVEVEKIWGMSGIKTMARSSHDQKLLRLLNSYQVVKKDSQTTRKSEIYAKKREEWKKSLDVMFECAAPDAEEVLRKSRLLGQGDKMEDLEFLIDQRTTRLQSIGERDTNFDQKIAEKENRENKKEKMKSVEKIRVRVEKEEEQEQRRSATKRELEEETKDKENDPDYEEAAKKTKRPDTVRINLPKAPFNDPFVTTTLDRLKVTTNQAMGFFGALVKTSVVDGERADLNKFVVSSSTLERQRIANREVAATLAMENFKKTKPLHSALHWDSKFLFDSLGQGWEAEAILVSGAPHWEEGKLLDVAELVDEEGGPSSTGQAQFQANKEVIKLWDLKKDIRALVFDTTASNTGCRRGCCVLIEKWLSRPVFFMGCRHHTSELLAKGSWHAVFDEDLSPENKLMSAFKLLWEELDTSPDAEVFTLTEDLPGKEEAIKFYLDILTNKNRNNLLPRDDYRYCSYLYMYGSPI